MANSPEGLFCCALYIGQEDLTQCPNRSTLYLVRLQLLSAFPLSVRVAFRCVESRLRSRSCRLDGKTSLFVGIPMTLNGDRGDIPTGPDKG